MTYRMIGRNSRMFS